jgi:hypothetical protein
MLRIMARIMIVVLSRRAAGLSLAGGLKNALKEGARAATPRRQPLFGVGTALSGQTAPCGALRHRSWLEPAAKNAHVDLRQPDCRALTVSGPVGDFYRRVLGRRVCRQDDP